MSTKRVVFDFDDTIAYTLNRDWEGATPNIELIERINKLYSDGWQIEIYTARGNISCKTRAEAAVKYGDQIRDWLTKHQVHYHTLSFEKPLADYYVDDKAITPEDFLKIHLEQLEGGLSGSDIYSDGEFVHKDDPHANDTIKWFEKANSIGLNVPRIKKLIGSTITMDYIEHDKDFFTKRPYLALGLIQEVLSKMGRNLPLYDKDFGSYVDRIKQKISNINDEYLTQTGEELLILLNATDNKHRLYLNHGDFGITNMLFTPGKELYLIDPIPYTFGSLELDVAKFCASLIVNRYPADLYSTSLHILSDFIGINVQAIKILIMSELYRIYPYHPDKAFMKGKIKYVFESI